MGSRIKVLPAESLRRAPGRHLQTLLLGIGLLALQGCVRLGFYGPAEHHEYVRIMTPNVPLTLTRDLDNRRVVEFDYYRRKTSPYTASDARRQWGDPDRTFEEAGYLVRVYWGGRLVWVGLAVQIMATIPLAIPVGHDEYHLYFRNDVLEFVRHQYFSTSLFVCDPAYGLVHAWGTAMSSTGGVSSVGPCTGITRKGLYNHFITNW